MKAQKQLVCYGLLLLIFPISLSPFCGSIYMLPRSHRACFQADLYKVLLVNRSMLSDWWHLNPPNTAVFRTVRQKVSLTLEVSGWPTFSRLFVQMWQLARVTTGRPTCLISASSSAVVCWCVDMHILRWPCLWNLIQFVMYNKWKLNCPELTYHSVHRKWPSRYYWSSQ